MARSLWIGTGIIVLASAWLALGQTRRSPPPNSAPTERTITVKEGDKPAQKCKVIKTWRTADGTEAFQVQALDTGELMTIVEESSSGAPSGPSAGGRVR